jgi:hypothetical protein
MVLVKVGKNLQSTHSSDTVQRTFKKKHFGGEDSTGRPGGIVAPYQKRISMKLPQEKRV